MPPAVGADLRAALVASCLRGALPPVLLRAVCLVRAIVFGGVGDKCVGVRDVLLFFCFLFLSVDSLTCCVVKETMRSSGLRDKFHWD